jgi:N-acetylated-alpha-linked acidic dipeptidase
VGTLLLRMADAPVLPFDFAPAIRTYRKYVEEIEKEAQKNETLKALDLTVIRAALHRAERAATAYETSAGRLVNVASAQLRRKTTQLRQLNQVLYQTEQRLADNSGLPNRGWYRHLIYAPGFFTGYGVKTMPGVREAVEDVPDLGVAQREAVRIANALDRYTQQIERAQVLLEQVLN